MNLNQVTVPSLDVSQSIDFYQKLGLKLIVNSHSSYARFECPEGGSTFSIHLEEEIADGAKPVVYFECDRLDEQVEKLKKDGIEMAEMPNDKPWLWREAHLMDPFGNKVVLYKAGENRKNPPWRL